MSRTQPAEAERRMLEFGCNQCGADAGDWCVVYQQPPHWTNTHRPAASLHAARFWAATAMGRLPIPAEDTA